MLITAQGTDSAYTVDTAEWDLILEGSNRDNMAYCKCNNMAEMIELLASSKAIPEADSSKLNYLESQLVMLN